MAQWPTFPSVIERDYKTFYYILNGNSFYVQQHLNGLFVIGLAPDHPIIRSKNEIIVDFTAGVRDFSSGVTSGKRKRDATEVNANSAICVIRTIQDQKEFIVPACVANTKVIAINKLLINHPELILNDVF
jgi:hypothetical protein